MVTLVASALAIDLMSHLNGNLDHYWQWLLHLWWFDLFGVAPYGQVSPSEVRKQCIVANILNSSPDAHASPTPTAAEVPPIASPSPNTTGLGGAINVGTSSGVLTVHGASTPLLSIMALVPILALTLQ